MVGKRTPGEGGGAQEVHALNTYSLDNVPSVLAVALKRFDETLTKASRARGSVGEQMERGREREWRSGFTKARSDI